MEGEFDRRAIFLVGNFASLEKIIFLVIRLVSARDESHQLYTRHAPQLD
jgi:hypothetical protein